MKNTTTMEQEPSNREILNTLDDFMEVMNQFANKMETRFQNMESEITSIKSQMVTKSYLDDKLADLRSELVNLARKGNAKLGALVEILQVRQVITEKNRHDVMALEPFAQ